MSNQTPTDGNMLPKKFTNPLKSSIDSVITQASNTASPVKDTLQPAIPSIAPLTTPTPSNTPPSTPPANPAPAAQGLVPAPSPARPTASTRPSWIGAPVAARPVTLGVEAMKQPVTIEHTSPGLQPPVYIFTSLSDPQWDAVEMEHEKMDNGENGYFKTFQAEEGEYQYKFRLGPGDWWALDDTKPTVDDGAGNKNNLLVVKAPEPPKPADQPAPVPVSQPAKAPEQPSPPPQAPPVKRLTAIQLPAAAIVPEAVPTPAAAPLLKHETFPPSLAPATQPTTRAAPPRSIDLPSSVPSAPLAIPGLVTSAPGPLLKHETLANPTPQPAEDMKDEAEQTYGDFDNDLDENDDDEDETSRSPLLRHESLSPESFEQTQAPLLRHESTGIGEHRDDDFMPLSPSITSRSSRSSRSSNGESAIAPEADPDDPSLERFPTTHQGILDHIQRASTNLPEDQTRDYYTAVSSDYAHSNPSLPSVQEDEDEEEMGILRKEEESAAREDAKEVDPSADTAPVVPEDGSNEELPAVIITEPDAPMTPPMTPKEAEMVVEEVITAAKAEGAAEQKVKDVVRQQIEAQVQEEAREEKVILEAVQEKGLLGTLGDVLMSPMAWFAIAGIAMAVAVGFWKLRYA